MLRPVGSCVKHFSPRSALEGERKQMTILFADLKGSMELLADRDPVDAFELLGAGPVRTRLQAAVARGLTRFVRRQHELDMLHQALERAQVGHGQVVALVGEPGVGKSRLFYEFTRWRDCVGAGRSPSHRTQGWLRLESSSVSYGKATAYLPLIEFLKGYFQIETGDPERRMREKLAGKLLMLDEALMPLLPVFLALLDVPVDDPQYRRCWRHASTACPRKKSACCRWRQ
jgi:hypothetical protein